MKNIAISAVITLSICCLTLLSCVSCGPVVFTTRLGTPTPPWFYPNRIETVRYIYFPDYTIYYDLSLRSYHYLDNGIWKRSPHLPKRYNGINLKRSKRVRINNYFDDDIRKYHNNRNTPRTSTRRKK